MKLTVNNQLVTLAELRQAWLEPVTVDLGDDARRRIAESQELIDDVVAHGDTIYGVNTGFGVLASVRIDNKELSHLQENLVRSHAVGVGEDLDDDVVRLVMLMKVIALAEGFSGVRVELVEALCELLDSEDVSLALGVPTVWLALLQYCKAAGKRLDKLQRSLVGGAAVPRAMIEAFRDKHGVELRQGWGMTETSPYLTFSILKAHLKTLPDDAQLKYKSKTGRPAIGVDLKVVDEQGDPVAADEQQVGEIWVKGDTITPGYWNQPKETASAFSNGWLHTGDLATLDSEGYVNIVDRKKDMIVTGGENVYSTEVENVLYMHPKILEAAVFGVPDERWGEAVNAAVVLRAGETATADEIIAFCKEHQAAYKAPKAIVFLDELPKTGSGKIYKKGLRDPFLKPKQTED